MHRLARVFVREDGGIEREAIICKCVESKSLVSGEAMYIIEAQDRIRIDKLIQKPGASFLNAYCVKKATEIDVVNRERNEILCLDLFAKLKIYLRLERAHRKMLETLMLSIGTPEGLISLYLPLF
jgi:hypothetical protein